MDKKQEIIRVNSEIEALEKALCNKSTEYMETYMGRRNNVQNAFRNDLIMMVEIVKMIKGKKK